MVSSNQMLAGLAILIFLGVSTYFMVPQKAEKESLNLIIFGDYGEADNNQRIVAKKMDEIAGEQETDMVLTFGDNFYSPNGVWGLDDPAFNTKWLDIYQTDETPNLKELTFFGSVGNHDFWGADVFAEIQYDHPHWVIEDFFYTHTVQLGEQTVAFVHVDTNLLWYGYKESRDYMRVHFDQLGWHSDAQMIEYAEEQLKKVKDADWIFAQAHHPIGFSCPQGGHTGLLYELFQKYEIDGYLNGHAHMLAYKEHADMLFLTSGAGANTRDPAQCEPSDPTFLVGDIIGFMSLNIFEDHLTIEVYWTGDQGEGGWQYKKLPDFQRRIKSHELL